MWGSTDAERRVPFPDSLQHTTSEVWFARADTPAGTFERLRERVQEVEYYVEHQGDYFYIRTNENGREFPVIAGEWRRRGTGRK